MSTEQEGIVYMPPLDWIWQNAPVRTPAFLPHTADAPAHKNQKILDF